MQAAGSVARTRTDALDLESVLKAAEDEADIGLEVEARRSQLGLPDRIPCSKYYFHHLRIPQMA